MAVSDPLIFDSVTIGSNTYNLTDSDNINISNEAEKLTVDNAQEIISGVESGMEVPIFDLAVQNDSNVVMDSDVSADGSDETTITLNGATGSSSVEIANVIVTGELKFDRPSPYVQLSVNIKAGSSQISIV